MKRTLGRSLARKKKAKEENEQGFSLSLSLSLFPLETFRCLFLIFSVFDSLLKCSLFLSLFSFVCILNTPPPTTLFIWLFLSLSPFGVDTPPLSVTFYVYANKGPFYSRRFLPFSFLFVCCGVLCLFRIVTDFIWVIHILLHLLSICSQTRNPFFDVSISYIYMF